MATTWAELLGPPPVPIPSGQRVVVVQRTAPHVVLKVRVRSSDMGKGTSRGFRVVLLERQPDHWQPIMIYPKNEQEDVQPSEVLKAMSEEISEPSAPVEEAASDASFGSSESEPPAGAPTP